MSSERRKVLFGENMKENVIKMVKTVANDMVERFTGEDTYVEDWDFESLETNVDRVFGIKDFNFNKEDLESLEKEDIKEKLEEMVKHETPTEIEISLKPLNPNHLKIIFVKLNNQQTMLYQLQFLKQLPHFLMHFLFQKNLTHHNKSLNIHHLFYDIF